MVKKKQADQRKPLSFKHGATQTGVTDADPSRITPVQKRILEAFSRCGSISRAVKVGGSCRATHYKALKHSPRYRAAFEQAQETFADHLRQAACHRAIRGVPRLKFYKGRVIKAPVLDKQGRPLLDGQGEPVLQPYVEYEYSDALLIRLLQARCPEFKKTTRLQNAGLSGGRFPQVDARKQYSTDLIRRFSAENLKPEAP